MRLAELQSRFVALVESAADDPGIFAPGPVPLRHALDVHRGTIESGFARVLSLGYPTVEALVGVGFFEHMARDYHDTGPQSDATLACYGAGFATFVASFEHAAGLPYLSDIALLDHAVERCQGAKDDHELFAIDTSVSLGLPTSLILLALAFPAAEIRAAIFDNDDDALATLDIAPRRRAAAVWRSGRSVMVKSIAPSAMRFLTALKSGATPDAALAAAAAEQPADILETLQTDVFAAPFAQVRPHPQEAES